MHEKKPTGAEAYPIKKEAGSASLFYAAEQCLDDLIPRLVAMPQNFIEPFKTLRDQLEKFAEDQSTWKHSAQWIDDISRTTQKDIDSRLAMRIAQKGPHLIARVFPSDIANVDGSLVGYTEYISPNQFWRGVFRSPTEGDAEYIRIKDMYRRKTLHDIDASAQNALTGSFDESSLSRVVRNAQTDAERELHDSIWKIHQELLLNIIELPRGQRTLFDTIQYLLGGIPNRQPIYAVDSDVLRAVSKDVNKLNRLLHTYHSDPDKYIHERTIEIVRNVSNEMVEAKAEQRLMEIITSNLRLFSIELQSAKSLVDPFVEAKRKTTDTQRSTARPQKKPKAQNRSEHIRHVEITRCAPVSLNLPWLEDPHESLDTYLYNDGTYTGYLVDAQSKKARSISERTERENPIARKQFQIHRNRMLEYAATGNINALAALRNTYANYHDEYASLTILYPKIARPDAPRTYITPLPEEYYAEFCKAIEADETETTSVPVILLLGQCTKSRQKDMLLVFFNTTQANLRKGGVGSI